MLPDHIYYFSEIFLFASFQINVRKQYAFTNISSVIYLDRSFAVPLSIRFVTSIYANITTSEWCLAHYEDENTWKCMSSITAESPGVYQGVIMTTGKFAVVYRMDNEDNPTISVIQRSQVGMDGME